MKKQVAIIHFNTPELTEAAIKSLRKHGCDWPVTVFDNSDRRPFTKTMDGVNIIDNTRGQVIDFVAELEKYPDREPKFAMLSNFGSFKHIITVQKLWKLLPDGFLLVESDVLIRKPIDFLWNEQFAACGKVQRDQPGNRHHIHRLLPFLCYMNVPLLVKHGARYFDPKRCWALQKGEMTRGNWYDTGAALLEDIRRIKPWLVARVYADLGDCYLHYHGGSWKQNDIERQMAWINDHRDLWAASDTDKIEVSESRREVKSKDVAMCAIVRCENKYLPEWVAYHLSLGVKKIYIYDNSRDGDEQPYKVLNDYTKTDAVEIIDFRNQGGDINVQDKAYNDCYTRHSMDYAWIGFLDIDEFVTAKRKSRNVLPTLLGKMNADVVVLSWRVMTDSGLVHYEPKLVRERFTKPFKGNRYEDGKEFVKSFVRGGLFGLLFQNHPHCPAYPDSLKIVNIKGEPVQKHPTTKPVYEVAWVDHYMTKTAEEFVEKTRRGFPNGERYTDDYRQKAVEYFFAINERTAEKEAVLSELSQ